MFEIEKPKAWYSSPWFIIAIIVIIIAAVGAGGYLLLKGEGGLTSHDPIYIEGNAGFTAANGVVAGSGTAGDPYIIEGWAINVAGAHGIQISYTTAYFVLRNCLVENSRYGYGIYLDNVINGKIEKCTCSNNVYGITLWGSNNILTNNTFSNNFNDGIWLSNSSNNTLTNNTCDNNFGSGIWLILCSNNVLTNNTCSNNQPKDGIWLDSSFNNILTNNTCSSNSQEGIYLENSSNNNLTNNTCSNNWYWGIYLDSSSDNNILTGNYLLNNAYGPYVDEGTNNHWS